MRAMTWKGMVLAAGVLLAGAWAWCSQTAMNLESLCANSRNIIVGTVKTVQGYDAEWPGVGKVIFSDVRIHVEEQWKGTVEGGDVVLQVPGGTAGDRRMRVSGAPVFMPGEKVLVFAAPYNGHLWVYGWEQGKYTVKVKRVVGRRGFPISEDILTYPLKRKVDRILAAQKREG